MGLFRKGVGDAPPDVGQEEEYDEKKGLSGEFGEDAEGKTTGKGKTKGDVPQDIAREVKSVVDKNAGAGLSEVQIEGINTRIDSIVEWIKQFYERFSYVSESIGEIRTMTVNNEKRISEAMRDAEKVIDVVKEVKPEELRVSYQKSDMKMTALAEKIEANKLFMDEVMGEMNELRRKSEVFIGTEGLMKLNSDTKKDLIEVQRLGSKTRMQADKAQEIFMELRKGFAESQKVGAIVENLDSSYAGLKEEVEKLKLDYGEVVKRSDYLDFKKTYGNKLVLFDNNVSDVEGIKQSLNEMSGLIETSLSVSRRNEEDIGEIGIKVGASDVKKVSDYENQLMEIVGIIETLSKQLAEVRKKVGLRVSKEIGVKKIVKPSDAAAEKVAEVKVAEVPKLKPEEFLGKKNLIAEKGERDLEKVEKKIGEVGEVKEIKPRVGIGGMIKRIATRVRPRERKVERGKEKKERKKKCSRGKKKKWHGKKKGSKE
ncbi:MAG: hypothetical protein V1889_02775 [archaeon]